MRFSSGTGNTGRKILQFNFYKIVFEILHIVLISLRLQFNLTYAKKNPKTPKNPTHCRQLFVARLFLRV